MKKIIDWTNEINDHAKKLTSIAMPSVGDEATGIAACYWLGIAQFENAVRHLQCEENIKSNASSALYVAHYAAFNYLARLADGLGLHGQAMREGGVIINRMLNDDFEKAYSLYLKFQNHWTDFVSSAHPTFPERQQKLLDEGQNVFRELNRISAMPTPIISPIPHENEPAFYRGLALAPGGFVYRSEKVHSLNGQPLRILENLLASRFRRATVDELVKAMDLDESHTDDPSRRVKQSAAELKKALITAAKEAGVECKPFGSTGNNQDLTYILDLPDD